MNQAVREYVASVIARYPQAGKRVLEVGSRDVNGSVRDLFADASLYIGVDRRAGPGVDAVADIREFDMKPTHGLYDTALCLEMLEHDPNPLEVLRVTHEMLKPTGLVIVTTRGIGYPMHDYPEDYFRFTEFGLLALMEHAGFKVAECIAHGESKGTFAYGFRA